MFGKNSAPLSYRCNKRRNLIDTLIGRFLVPTIPKHVYKPNTCARALFLHLHLIWCKQTFATKNGSNPYLIHWFASFAWVQLLFCAFSTDACRTETPNQYILKCSDDTDLGSLLRDSDKAGLHHSGVNKVVKRRDHNAHEINTKKSDEIVFGSPSRSHKVPFVIQKGNKFKQVLLSKHSGIMTNGLLSQKDLAELLCKNTKQRMVSTISDFFFTSVTSVWAFFSTAVLHGRRICPRLWGQNWAPKDKKLLKDCQTTFGGT